jgi:hypothetical protein
VSQKFSIGFLAGGRFFQEATSVYSGVSMFGVGAMPEFVVSPGITIPVRLRFQTGKLENDDQLQELEIGAGIAVVL